jgi:hypothetical protein
MKKKTERLYIAYGSNLNRPQMERRCPGASVAGISEVADYELLFRNVATIEPRKGAKVPVVLWQITPEDERALDRYEGWPRLYRKEMMELELEGKPVSAMVYVMNEGRKADLPASYYYDVISEGYQTFGFDEKVLEQAVGRTMELIKQEAALEEVATPEEVRPFSSPQM